MSSQKNKHNYLTDNFVRIIKTDIQKYGVKNSANITMVLIHNL